MICTDLQILFLSLHREYLNNNAKLQKIICMANKSEEKKAKNDPFGLLREPSKVLVPKEGFHSAHHVRMQCVMYYSPQYPPSIYSTRHYHKLPFIFFTIFLLHNSWVPSAQQLMGICTTAVVRLEVLTFPKTDIISSDNFYYYFRQLMLFLSTAHHSTYNDLS